MKKQILISLVLLVGFLILFFFPEPETNFFAYLGTALFFIIIILLLIKPKKKK
jgi:hypothetical protein